MTAVISARAGSTKGSAPLPSRSARAATASVPDAIRGERRGIDADPESRPGRDRDLAVPEAVGLADGHRQQRPAQGVVVDHALEGEAVLGRGGELEARGDADRAR